MCLHTQLLPFLQYNIIDRNNILVTTVVVAMADNILIFMGGPKISVNDLSFVTVLFILEMEMCFISGIFLVKASSLMSVRLNIY